VVIVTGTVIGGCQAGEAVIGVVDGNRAMAGVAARQDYAGRRTPGQCAVILRAGPELCAVQRLNSIFPSTSPSDHNIS